MMRKPWVWVILLAVFTVVFAPSEQPALPEPDARRIVARAFGASV